MHKIDWSLIDKGSTEKICSIAATFQVILKRNFKVTIKIYEYPQGFIAFSSHSFWGPKQAGPYQSNHIQDSIEYALNDAIRGLESFDEESFSNEKVFYVTEDSKYFDGNGIEVSRNEVTNRHKS